MGEWSQIIRKPKDLDSPRLQYLKKQATKYDLITTIETFICFSIVLVALFVSVSSVIYNFSHDSMTAMQICKWSISKYFLAYVYIVIVVLLGKTVFKAHLRFQQEISKEIDKEIERLEKENSNG